MFVPTESYSRVANVVWMADQGMTIRFRELSVDRCRLWEYVSLVLRRGEVRLPKMTCILGDVSDDCRPVSTKPGNERSMWAK
jgi:hypothetical protein